MQCCCSSVVPLPLDAGACRFSVDLFNPVSLNSFYIIFVGRSDLLAKFGVFWSMGVKMGLEVA